MRRRKTLKELTLKDDFMFGAVMSDENNCRRLLELVLGFPIDRVEISREKSIIYRPEYKGVRLDMYAKDGNNTHYNVEMQAVMKAGLGRRSRYYHSHIDMDLLLSGKDYSELPNTYVIFICDFDPFGQSKYRYAFRNRCAESPEADLQDGSETIFLNTMGNNREEVSDKLVKFLNYVRADLEESQKDFDDDFIRSLQENVAYIKKSRRMEEQYMLMSLLLKEAEDEARAEGRMEGLAEGRMEGLAEGRMEGLAEGRAEGLAEIIFDFLGELGNVSEELQAKIKEENDPEVLKRWNKLAARADSIEWFMSEM